VTLKTYFTPESQGEALSLKAEYGRDLWLMAGGTIFMPLINDGYIFPEMVMGLRRAGMDAVQVNGTAVSSTAVIGAGATLTQMTELAAYPMLQQAAQAVGGWAVRNMGTVGGNLFARAPYGDVGVALLALNATLKVASSSAERTVSLADFYGNDRQLAPDELITEIHVPKTAGQTYYHKHSPRQANSPTIVAVAVNLKVDNGRVSSAAIALGGAAPIPVRAEAAESILAGAALNEESIGAAAEAAADASNPITDAVASEWYRRKMVAVQLKRALESLATGGN
jgi:CO/xanthine dehydrogenase FAD-binding subunit